MFFTVCPHALAQLRAGVPPNNLKPAPPRARPIDKWLMRDPVSLCKARARGRARSPGAASWGELPCDVLHATGGACPTPDLPPDLDPIVGAPEPDLPSDLDPIAVAPEPDVPNEPIAPLAVAPDSPAEPMAPPAPIAPIQVAPDLPSEPAPPIASEPVAIEPPVIDDIAPEVAPPEVVPAPAASVVNAAERQAYYESKAEELGKLTAALARTRGVTSIFLVARDGSTIDSVVKDDVTEERVGELVKESFEFLLAYAKSPSYWVLECTGGIFVMQTLDAHHVLIAIGQAGANFGALRYTMDKTKAKFGSILDNVPL